MSRSATLQPLSPAGLAELAEGPVWDARLQRIYWVDIIGHNLHWLAVGATQRETLPLGDTVGFVSLTEDPHMLIVGLGDRLVWLNLTTSHVSPLADLTVDGPGLRCNDGKCDPTGRLWAGTMPRSSTAGSPTGSVYSLDGDGSLQRRISGLGCSNGLAWNPEARLFFFIDSPTCRIDRYLWDADTGDIEPQEPLTRFKSDDGLPDGMCIDTAGNLWVAFWGGACVRHIDGRSGDVLARIDVPVEQVTSCTFGGPDLETLFITTAAEGLSATQRAAQPLAGSLFTVRPGARGVTASTFDRRFPLRA